MMRTAVLLLTLGFAITAHGGTLEVANALRAESCARATTTLLREDTAVADIAKRWSGGGRLQKHIPSGYGAVQFVSFHLRGIRDQAMLARALREQFCEAIADPKFTRLGSYRRGDEYWIVLSSAADAPTTSTATAVRREALQWVNRARATARRCGTRSYPPVPPLALNDLLNRAAEAHARNMAQHRKLQHEGFDGSTPAQRAQAAGYRWRAIGENIAAGPTNAGAVVKMWLESPGHCANLMSASFTEMGFAFADDPERGSGVYWAQTFGRPR